MEIDIISDTLSNLFISLFGINDFKTLFLILVAIFLGKLISNPLSNVSINLAHTLRAILKVKPEDKISDRSIVSFFYCVAVFFASFLVTKLHPEYSMQEKIISSLAWPFLSYILLSGILLVITPFLMFPYDLLMFVVFFSKRFFKK